MPSISWTHTASTDSNRLDSILAERVDSLSRSAAQRVIREGAVMVDGTVVTRPSYTISDGQSLEVSLPEARPEGVIPVEAALNIVLVDEHIVLVDKPAGIAVHPGSGHIDDTLVNHLLARFPGMESVGERDRPGVVHRLDRDTSGLLVFALSNEAYEALVSALKKRKVSRTYTALVYSHPPQDSGVVDAPVGRDPRNRTRQAIVTSGRSARTRYRVVKHIGHWSLLELQLETGRMHQIRVHMAAVGLPVAGDPTYGNAPKIQGLDRQFLHASQLEFEHPVTGNNQRFASPLPANLRLVLDQLEESE